MLRELLLKALPVVARLARHARQLGVGVGAARRAVLQLRRHQVQLALRHPGGGGGGKEHSTRSVSFALEVGSQVDSLRREQRGRKGKLKKSKEERDEEERDEEEGCAP